jgi:hypothetical protein
MMNASTMPKAHQGTNQSGKPLVSASIKAQRANDTVGNARKTSLRQLADDRLRHFALFR